MFNPRNYGLPLPPNRRQLAATRISLARVLLSRSRRFAQNTGARSPAPAPSVAPVRRSPARGKLFTPIDRDLVETRTVRDVLGLLTKFAQRRKLVQITYRKLKDGSITQRLVEPYSLRYKRTKNGGRARYFYAYDTSGSPAGIRSFRMSNVLAVLGTNRSYYPRWQVEF